MRFGLMTNEKRSWNKIGERSKLPNQMEYANRYLYSAISPIEGDSFHIIGFSSVDSATTNVFLDELQKQYPDTHNILIWDNAPFHKPQILHTKQNLTILPLPSYGQELNPVERFFAEMRKVTANRTFKDISEIENLLDDEVVVWTNDKERMRKLTCWDWIKEQINKTI
jgi:transposase